MQNNKARFILWWMILFLIAIKLIIFLSSNRTYFTRKFDPQYYGDLYTKSQYVVGSASEGGIGDDGLYAFAGYYYLFKGGDVSAVNFEHPPLGKYLIGLSILLFKNENIINIIYFLTLLWVVYRIGKIILIDSLLSLVSVGVLTLDPLFLDNLIRSLLDLPFTLFFSLGIYFFLLALRNSKYYPYSMLFWGFSFATRFFPSMFIIYAYLISVVLLYKRNNLSTILKSSIIIPIIYLISHTAYFAYHPSFLEFLRHKKWMLAWFTGSVRITGNIWRNIYTGYYLDTTNKLAVNHQWSVSLPIIVSLSLVPVRKFLDVKKNMDLTFLYGLCILYLIYVTFLTDGVGKFLMPIYPLLCILAVRNLASLYSIITVWKKRNSAHSRAN